jgi:guanylate kinase
MNEKIKIEKYKVIDDIANLYEIYAYWDLVKTKNPSNNKPYHNLYHIACVVKHCYDIAKSLELEDRHIRRLLIAAMYHNFGYFSSNDYLNIIKATRMLGIHSIHINRPAYKYGGYKVSNSDIDLIKDIIRATQYPYVIQEEALTLSQRIIRDADLLQWTEETFIDHVVKGVAEEMQIPLVDFIPKQKIFMAGVKFHTTFAKAKHREFINIRLAELDEFEKNITSAPMHKRIILVARAASGKDYLKAKFINKGFLASISYTTRPPRANEVNGVDYFFISKDEANRMIELNLFYEYVQFNNWLYGTSKQSFYHDDVFIMTPTGLSHVSEEDRANSIVIYLDIDSTTRRERLNKRDMPGDSVDRRIEADELDFKDFTDYDVRISNHDF